jgi:LytR cell envelope-related transcriptional attenuator/LytR_cpsA_psr family
VTLVAPRKDAPAPTRDDRPSSVSGRRFEVPAFLRDLTWRFWVFVPALAVLVLAVPVLTWKGFSILRHEETGQRRDVVTDPTAEGYEALVTSTPTALQLDLDGAGALAGVTLLTRPSQQGGGNIVFLPVGTVMQVPLPGDAGVLERTLAQIYAEGGAAALEQRVESLLGAGVGEVIEVPIDQWASLVEPVAPLTVQNPTAVSYTDAAGNSHAFAGGTIQLAAADVGFYLQAKSEEETDTVRITRHEAFWRAWFRALDQADDNAVPGEGDTGIGAFVRGLTHGPRSMTTLPAAPVPLPGVPLADSDLFRPNALSIVSMVPDLIPFPVGVGRLRTRLVDGVGGDDQLLPTTAHLLVQAGSEISVIANAEQFGVEETQVVYFRPEQRERAQRLLDALGTGTLVRDSGISDNVDVVVILGQDYVDASGGEPTATTVVPGATVPGTVPTGGVETNGGIPSGVEPGLPGGETTG